MKYTWAKIIALTGAILAGLAFLFRFFFLTSRPSHLDFPQSEKKRLEKEKKTLEQEKKEIEKREYTDEEIEKKFNG